MNKAGNEFIRTWISNQPSNLCPKCFGKMQRVLFGKLQKLGIRWTTPQEVRKPDGEFTITQFASLAFICRFVEIQEPG